jgi:hypothetical protein
MTSAASAEWATPHDESSTIDGFASERTISLSSPDRLGGRPLMQLLAWQRSSEGFASAALTHERLSNLLWAANGVIHQRNEPTSATAGTNARNVNLYAILRGGAYRYDPLNHCLDFVSGGSANAAEAIEHAPLKLVCVADNARMGDIPAREQDLSLGLTAGAIAQNVRLFCASEGLSVSSHDAKEQWTLLSEQLQLGSGLFPIIWQVIGG